MIRSATIHDAAYIAQSFINIVVELKRQASDIYIDGLPEQLDQATQGLAESYLSDSNALVLLAENNNKALGCIAVKIEETSFPPSGIGLVGNIAMCWVEPEYRQQKVATRLVAAVEDWVKEREINVLELSYLAHNHAAMAVWGNMGYTPFRVFAHKVLK